MGEALVFSLKQVSAQDWGACVPSRTRALTRSQSQHMVGPLKVLNQVVFNVLKNPNALKDDEASAVLDAAVVF